jgi:integrase/recombinase XerD
LVLSILDEFPPNVQAWRLPLRDVQEAASHADPRTTMRYDRGRQSLDRHATYIVATFVAGASR